MGVDPEHDALMAPPRHWPGETRISSDAARLRVLNQDTQNLVEFKLKADGTLVDEPDAVTSLGGVCGQVLHEVPL